jgi:hypothetical protein
MTMVLKYNHSTNTTCGYLGFQVDAQALQGKAASRPSPGHQLLTRLKFLKEKAGDPMLLPVLAAGLWVEYLHNQNYQSGRKLHEVQGGIGLMASFLQPRQSVFKQPIKFDEVHPTILLQHAFLTNGISEFIADLFPSTKNAMQAFRDLRCPPQPQQQQQQPGPRNSATESMEELEEFIDHMHIRARAELQHHDRMLGRINLYLQVVSWDFDLAPFRDH